MSGRSTPASRYTDVSGGFRNRWDSGRCSSSEGVNRYTTKWYCNYRFNVFKRKDVYDRSGLYMHHEGPVVRPCRCVGVRLLDHAVTRPDIRAQRYNLFFLRSIILFCWFLIELFLWNYLLVCRDTFNRTRHIRQHIQPLFSCLYLKGVRTGSQHHSCPYQRDIHQKD